MNAYIFIDESNVWSIIKSKRKLIEWDILIKELEKKFYYAAYPKNNTRTYNTNLKFKFFVYLKNELGFVIKLILQILIEFLKRFNKKKRIEWIKNHPPFSRRVVITSLTPSVKYFQLNTKGQVHCTLKI